MKKYMQLLVLIPLILLSACDSEKPSISPVSSEREKTKLLDMAELPSVTMRIDYNSYQVGVIEIDVYWENMSQYVVIYGEHYELYNKIIGGLDKTP